MNETLLYSASFPMTILLYSYLAIYAFFGIRRFWLGTASQAGWFRPMLGLISLGGTAFLAASLAHPELLEWKATPFWIALLSTSVCCEVAFCFLEGAKEQESEPTDPGTISVGVTICPVTLLGIPASLFAILSLLSST